MNIQYPEIPDLVDSDDQNFFRQLHSDDEKIRFITLMNIAEEERVELLPWLHYAILNDPSAQVREQAAKSLEGWEDTDSLNALAQALQDSTPEVVNAARQSLSEVKQQSSADILVLYLQQDTLQINQVQVKAAILAALKPLRTLKYYDDILAHTKHQDIRVRREAVRALSWLQQEQAVNVLADIVQNDSDSETRRIATGGLGYSKQHSEQVIIALQTSLESDDWQLRVEAALTIGKLKIANLQQALIDLLLDGYWQVRIAVVRSLGLLKSQQAFAGLADNFNHEISNLRKEVALALGEIGGHQALDLLLQHQDDTDPEVRKAVRIGLNQLVFPVKYPA